MSLEIIRLLFDFGLLILIWIVQRIVYPSFLHYSTKDLIVWHRSYTSRFSFIVMPLMLGQLMISFYQLILNLNFYTVLSLGIIILIWLSTFLQFVPMHRKISQGKVDEKLLNELVKKNWIRTFLWTLLLVLSFIQVFE